MRRAETETYLENVIEVIDKWREYWALTLRQVYYQLVGALIIENHLNQYKKLSRVLKAARLSGEVPWESIEDRSRTVLYSDGWDDKEQFINYSLRHFLVNYRRDLLATQDVRPEIWLEKDALSTVVHRVADPYCVNVIVARGFASMTLKNQCRERILENAKTEQKTQILYFGDFDPSGKDMLPSMMKTLYNEMSVPRSLLDGRHIALTPEQINQYNLPINPDALKDTDSRTKKHRQQYGNLAVELDALPPDVLESMVRDAIEESLDMTKLRQERSIEQEELMELKDISIEVTGMVEDYLQ